MQALRKKISTKIRGKFNRKEKKQKKNLHVHWANDLVEVIEVPGLGSDNKINYLHQPKQKEKFIDDSEDLDDVDEIDEFSDFSDVSSDCEETEASSIDREFLNKLDNIDNPKTKKAKIPFPTEPTEKPKKRRLKFLRRGRKGKKANSNNDLARIYSKPGFKVLLAWK